MPANTIISHCLIDENIVRYNGQPILKNEGQDPLTFLEHIYKELALNYPRFYKMDNLSRLGFLASELLLRETDRSAMDPDLTGLVLCNRNASLDTDIRYYQSVKEIPSPALFVYTLPNIMIGEICIRNRFRGENAFFVADRFPAAFLVQYVDNLINSNILRHGLCGWVDLLHDSFRAALFLVGPPANKSSGSLLFDQETIEKIYSPNHGYTDS